MAIEADYIGITPHKAQQPYLVLRGGLRDGEVLSEDELTEENLAGYRRSFDVGRQGHWEPVTDTFIETGPRGGKERYTIQVWELVA